MKNRPLLIAFIFLFNTVIAQPTVKYYNYKWEETSPKYGAFYSITKQNGTTIEREDYFVALNKLQMSGAYTDATEKVGVGKFHWFHSNGQLERVGDYLNGKRDGVWLSFYENGSLQDSAFYENGKVTGSAIRLYRSGFQEDSLSRINDSLSIYISWFDGGTLASTGRLLNEKKNGKWVYYHRNNEKSAIEVYENGLLKSKSYFSENGDIVDTTKFADKSALFKSGVNGWLDYLKKNLYYPDNVKLENTDKIVVVVVFEVDENGNVINSRVKTPFHYEYDKIALKVVNNSPKWNSELYKNRHILSSFQQAVFFEEKEE